MKLVLRQDTTGCVHYFWDTPIDIEGRIMIKERNNMRKRIPPALLFLKNKVVKRYENLELILHASIVVGFQTVG